MPLAPFPVIRSSCPRSTALTKAVRSTSGLDAKQSRSRAGAKLAS